MSKETALATPTGPDIRLLTDPNGCMPLWAPSQGVHVHLREHERTCVCMTHVICVRRQIKAHLSARGIKMEGLNLLKKEDLVGLLDTAIAKAEQRELDSWEGPSLLEPDPEYPGGSTPEQAIRRLTMQDLKEVGPEGWRRYGRWIGGSGPHTEEDSSEIVYVHMSFSCGTILRDTHADMTGPRSCDGACCEPWCEPAFPLDSGA